MEHGDRGQPGGGTLTLTLTQTQTQTQTPTLTLPLTLTRTRTQHAHEVLLFEQEAHNLPPFGPPYVARDNPYGIALELLLYGGTGVYPLLLTSPTDY